MKKINPLTGLLFGQAFFTEVEEYMEKIEPNTHCMMAMDIEHFRLYNTIHGKNKADQMLVEIASVLKAYHAEHGGVVGYLGGDNFAIVTEYKKNELQVLRKEIRNLIRKRNNTTGYPPAYGIYPIIDIGEAPSSMYNHATVALSYVIGNYTTRCMEYYPDMDGRMEEEIRLLASIQEGIENDEFTFYVQPQFDINKGKIVGGESLVRWISKEKGFVSPGVFIPVLEKNGFIADLDQIVWEKVCQWLRTCIDKGYEPVPISINVSRIDIFSLNVPEYLISLVDKYRLTPDLVKIEITESAYAEEGEVIVQTASKLKELGFLVMMDDFGSGYSSLNMLKSMPVDVIKMDMRFLEINEHENDKGIGIIESVVNMARQMRIPIVVEGVETQLQEDLLRKVGCCYTQGFYYYRPMPLVDFEELLTNDENLDHGGFWYHQAESVHLKELLDNNLFSDTVINSILGPAAFYDMYENKIEVTRVNDQYFELAGISREEGDDYRKRFWNSVRDDDRQLLYSIFEQAYESPVDGASGYIHYVRRDGRTIWVHIKVFLLREKEGHRLFYASLSDVTELKDNNGRDKSLISETAAMGEEQLVVMDDFYGNLPFGFGIGKINIDEDKKPIGYEINYANGHLSHIAGGDMHRLTMLSKVVIADREEEFLQAAYRAAYEGTTEQMHLYSSASNRYYDFTMSQYQTGYIFCLLQDETRAQIYEGVSNSIMSTFREVYYLQLQDNYCRKVYPEDNELLDRGNYEEVVNRHFDNGRIKPYDEANVRKFLSLEYICKELKTQDSIEYRYKRAIEPAGEEWCQVTISVSTREEDGTPKTANVTIRSVEVLMREKDNQKSQNLAISLASMSDGFFVYNAADDEKIVFANSPVIHMFGCKDIYEFRQHVNGCFPGLVHPEDVYRVEWEIVEQQKSSEKNLDFIRYRIIRKDGEVRWVEDVGYLETSNDTDIPEMFYVFISDITDKLSDAQKNKLILESQNFNKRWKK